MRKRGKNQDLVRPSGLEPPTPTMSRWCSNQLSYGRISFNLLPMLDNLVRPSGLEPPTPTMSRWCSNQLSYGRISFNLLPMLDNNVGASEWTRTTDPHHVKVVL